MKLGEDNAPMVTDNYNYIRLIWADDTSIIFRLNLYALELQANGRYHNYYMEQSEPFWKLVYARINGDYFPVNVIMWHCFKQKRCSSIHQVAEILKRTPKKEGYS